MLIMTDEKLYGIRPILEALQGERRLISQIFISTQRRGQEIQQILTLAEQRSIPVVMVERPQLERLLGHSAHQGVIALAKPHAYQAWDETLKQVTTTVGPQTVLCLDCITDVGNFAALIRSAAAFGVRVILVPRHGAVSLTPAVAKHSAGAIERVAIVRVTNIVRALEDLKQHGFWVYGADMQADTPVARMAWPERLVLVLGAEHDGMRRLVRTCCDAFVGIPMHEATNSLNVAVAGAILLAYRWDDASRAAVPYKT